MADVCTSYSYVLAAEDMVPVIAGAVGYFYLHRRVRAEVPAAALPVAIAGILIVLGGFSAGVMRKILVVAGGQDTCYLFLQRPFFSILAPSFAILMWGAWCVMAKRKISFWPFFVLLVLGVAGAVAANSNPPLLAAGGLWAVGLAVVCAIISVRQDDRLAAVLFILNAIGVLALPVLGSREGVSDVTNQWTAQGVNTVSQLLFAYACYRLWSVYQRRTATLTPSEV